MKLIRTYLAPMPHRGKQNQPAYVRYETEHLEELRDTGLEQVAAVITANYRACSANADVRGAKATVNPRIRLNVM